MNRSLRSSSFIFLHLVLSLWVLPIAARTQIPPLATACETISEHYLFTNCTRGVFDTPECQCNSSPWLGSMVLCITDNGGDDREEQHQAWTLMEQTFCLSQPDSIANTMSMEAILLNATQFVVALPDNPATDNLQAPIRFPVDELTLIDRSNREFNNQLQYGLNYGSASCALVFGFMVLGMLNNLFHHCFSWRYKPKRMSSSSPWIQTIRRYIINPTLFTDGLHLQNASWFGVLVSYPSRLESIAVFIYVALNICLLFPHYDLFVENTFWPNDTAAQLARYVGDRSGEMSFAQLPMVYLFGGRNNILIWLTGWSYDRFIVAHKWTSRVMVIHAIVHTVAYTWYCAHYGFEMFITFFSDPYLLWGVLAIVLSIVVLLLALPNLRRSCYDLFLYSHIILVLLFTVGCWYHVALLEDEENLMWLYISICIWSFDRVARLVRVIYYNIMLATGQRWLRTVKADIIPGTDCIRFRVDANKYGLCHRMPGVFVYIYVPGVYFWQSHPFTIASWHQPSDHPLTTTSGASSRYGTMAVASPALANNKVSSQRSLSGNTFDLLIRPQQGMTKKLYKAVEKLGPGGGDMEVLIEGPYGHTHPLLQYDTAILIGGGVGCTATVPYLQEAVYNANLTATRHLIFIWVVQYDDQLSWAQDDIEECLGHINRTRMHPSTNDEVEVAASEKSALALDVAVYVTRSTRESENPKKGQQQEGWNVAYGIRPDLDKLLGQYVENAPESVAMLHCGPDRMSDQIRRISARHGIPYFEEAFNWKSSASATMDITTQSSGDDPLTSSTLSDTSMNGTGIDSNKPPSFLQRIASSDTIFRPAAPSKRPSTTSLHKSSSSSALQPPSTQSFSIPIPSNSWGMKALSQLQDSHRSEYDDIVDLLLDDGKAVLLLPVSRPTHPSVHIDLEFIKDHVIIYPPQGKSHVMSLSGIRGAFQKDQFVALDLSSSEYDITFSLAKSDDKRSPFDAFDLDPTSITSDHPVCNILATHVPVKLRDDKIIKAMLIQKPLSKSDVMEWMRNRQESGPATSPPSSSASSLPHSSKAPPLDDPLASSVETFLSAFRQRPPKTMTMASEQWADFLDDLRDSMDNSTGNNVDNRLDTIESYMCRELYDKLFIAGTTDDSFQDEVLESRIAAVNLLDLNLGHLGVTVAATEVDSITDMVNTAGTQLQQLNSIPGAKEKLDILVRAHQIIVGAIERFADQHKDTSINADLEVVQEMKQAMFTVNDIDSRTTTTNPPTDQPNNNNVSITSPRPDNTSDKVPSLETTADSTPPVTATNNSTASQLDSHIPSTVSKSEQTNLWTASADVLLPLLIFTIVKSNPTNFMSNLKFIQRFRHPNRLNGQASYCLTNILAAVSFLETTNLVGLGLSADKVHSNITDLNALMPSPLSSNQSGQTTTAPSSGGMKLVSEVMDSSYRVFDGIGRFWQQRNHSDMDGSVASSTATATTTSAPSSSSPGTYAHNATHHRSNHGITSLSPSELKDMAASAIGLSKSKKDPSGWDNAVPGFLEQRKGSIKPSRSTSTTSSSSSSAKTDHFQAILQAPSQFMQTVQQKSNKRGQYEAPIQKFLDMKSVDALTIGEVGELLADYKRLAAILKQSNVLQ